MTLAFWRDGKDTDFFWSANNDNSIKEFIRPRDSGSVVRLIVCLIINKISDLIIMGLQLQQLAVM